MQAGIEVAATPTATDSGPGQAMTPWYVEANMRALALAEEAGFWYAVGRMLNGPVFAVVRTVASADELVEIELCGIRLKAARTYEAVHGEHSLVRQDHWLIRKMEDRHEESRRMFEVRHRVV